jgi:hypothetical protein
MDQSYYSETDSGHLEDFYSVIGPESESTAIICLREGALELQLRTYILLLDNTFIGLTGAYYAFRPNGRLPFPTAL